MAGAEGGSGGTAAVVPMLWPAPPTRLLGRAAPPMGTATTRRLWRGEAEMARGGMTELIGTRIGGAFIPPGDEGVRASEAAAGEAWLAAGEVEDGFERCGVGVRFESRVRVASGDEVIARETGGGEEGVKSERNSDSLQTCQFGELGRRFRRGGHSRIVVFGGVIVCDACRSDDDPRRLGPADAAPPPDQDRLVRPTSASRQRRRPPSPGRARWRMDGVAWVGRRVVGVIVV